MKDSHIYNRMNELDTIIYYLDYIQTKPLQQVKFLVGNITLEANDHVLYPTIIEAFQQRLINEQL
jgi:hypothetical protein